MEILFEVQDALKRKILTAQESLKHILDRETQIKFNSHVKLLDYNGMKYRVIIEIDEDGTYVASVPSLPGCISQGKTREKAIKNVKDAIKGYLESLRKHGEPIPSPIEEEIIEVHA